MGDIIGDPARPVLHDEVVIIIRSYLPLSKQCTCTVICHVVQRDPSKRRVKPVEKHLLQIHFGMSDDDDTDSDYEFKPGQASDDDIGSDDSAGMLSDPTNPSKDKPHKG